MFPFLFDSSYIDPRTYFSKFSRSSINDRYCAKTLWWEFGKILSDEFNLWGPMKYHEYLQDRWLIAVLCKQLKLAWGWYYSLFVMYTVRTKVNLVKQSQNLWERQFRGYEKTWPHQVTQSLPLSLSDVLCTITQGNVMLEGYRNRPDKHNRTISFSFSRSLPRYTISCSLCSTCKRYRAKVPNTKRSNILSC